MFLGYIIIISIVVCLVEKKSRNLLAVFVVAGLSTILRSYYNYYNTDISIPWFLYAIAIGYLSTIAALLCIIRKSKQWLKRIQRNDILYICLVPPVLLFEYFLIRARTGWYLQTDGLSVIAIISFLLLLGGAIVEEVLFRFALYDIATRHFKKITSCLALSALFALMHIRIGRDIDILILLNHFVFSLVLFWVRTKRNSLIPVAAIHFVVNIFYTYL